MAEEQKIFSGRMNLDDSNEVIGLTEHKDANNVRFIGDDKTRMEGVAGTREVVNEFLPATDDNITVYVHYDMPKKRQIIFNYNSGGLDGIFIYHIDTATHEVLLQVGAATDGNILNFDLITPIHSVDIVYGDSIDGDLLKFTDTLGRLTLISIDKFLNDPYPVTKRLYIDVATAPPVMPAECTYENDADVTNNTLKNSLFQFAYAHKKDNNLLTLMNEGSIVPLPYLPFDVASDTDATRNARIAVYMQTGDIDVKELRLYMRSTKDGATSAWQLVTSLIKSELSIASNDIYKFNFYNNAIYPDLDPAYSTPIQDYVPLKVGCSTIINGNTIACADITEGMDLPEADVEGSVTNELYPYTTLNGLLFFASQNGQQTNGTGDTIVVYLAGTGTNTAGNVTTLNNCNAIFKVDAIDNVGGDIGFEFDNVPSPETVTNIFDGLSAAAVIAGWTELSRTDNTMTLQYSTDVTLYGNGILRSALTSLSTSDAIFSYADQSNYSFGLVYKNKHGNISSTLTDIPYNIKTPVEETNKQPVIELQINHRPLTDAVSYSVVRSQNLTYGKRLTWVSFAAYTGIIGVNNEQYAYIDIANINTYNTDIKSTSGVVAYTFANGDRIRFTSRIEFNGTRHALIDKDYEILGQVTTITLTDSTKKIGNFIQIKYPTADIGGDFAFDGSFDFMNYQILLYNILPRESSSDLTYFMFGKEFGIGNAGTTDAYHIGQEQSQTENLSQPAIITTSEGDYFLRTRTVPTGMTYQHTLEGYENGWNDYTTIPIEVIDSPVTTPYYIITTETFQNAGIGAGDFPTFADTPYFENTSGDTIRIRIRVKIVFTNDVPLTAFEILGKIDNTVPLAPVTIVTMYPNTGILQQNIEHTAEIDSIINVPPSSRFSMIMHKTGSKVWVTSSQLTFDVLNQAPITIIEDSFSDVYAIRTNSNSKVNTVEPNAREAEYPNLMRWSLAYNPGTNVNELNRFLYLNSDESNRSNGATRRLGVIGQQLYIFLQRATGQTGVYTKFIQSSTGTPTITTTNDIITKNNIQYYDGITGVGDHPEGLVKSERSFYWVDPVTGKQIRLSNDGITFINVLYKGQYTIGDILAKYDKVWTNTNGGNAIIRGCFDFFEQQYMCLLQGGTNGEDTIPDYMFSFNEKRNAYCSFYDFHPEFILCVDNKLVSYLNGKQYIHDNTDAYCNFYGTQYYPSVTLAFNANNNVKKKFNSIAYQSNQFWVSDTNGDIITSMINPQTNLQQISQLKSVDYEIEENIRYAAFLFDANSMSDAQMALVEGDFLGGMWLQIKLIYKGSEFSYLYLPYILYELSPRNF